MYGRCSFESRISLREPSLLDTARQFLQLYCLTCSLYAESPVIFILAKREKTLRARLCLACRSVIRSTDVLVKGDKSEREFRGWVGKSVSARGDERETCP